MLFCKFFLRKRYNDEPTEANLQKCPTEVNGAQTTASQTSPRRCGRVVFAEKLVNVFAHNNAGARLEPLPCGVRDEGVTAQYTASGETQKGYEKGGGQQS